METLNYPSAISPELGIRANHASPVIIATDGRAQSDSALVVGRLFAESPEALRLVTVLKTMPVIPDAPMSVAADLESARRAEVRARAARRKWRERGTTTTTSRYTTAIRRL